MTEIAHESALFDGGEYEIPFAKIDNHEVTDFVLGFAGNLRLSRNNPEHVALMEQLELGRFLTVSAEVSVDGKMQTFRRDAAENELVTYGIRLRVHSMEAVEA